MKLSFDALLHFELDTLDRDNAAKIVNFLYDDQKFQIQYLVVRCGSWLFGDLVLVPPAAIKGVDLEFKSIKLGLTSKKLESCPSRNQVETVSEDLILEMTNYYPEHYPIGDLYYGFAGWPALEGGSTSWEVPPVQHKKSVRSRDPKINSNHIRSITILKNYSVVDEIKQNCGKIFDLVLNLSTNSLDELIIDSGNWLHSDKHLVNISRVDKIDELDHRVVLKIARHELEAFPKYSEFDPVNRSLEARKYDYWGRPADYVDADSSFKVRDDPFNDI